LFHSVKYIETGFLRLLRDPKPQKRQRAAHCPGAVHPKCERIRLAWTIELDLDALKSGIAAGEPLNLKLESGVRHFGVARTHELEPTEYGGGDLVQISDGLQQLADKPRGVAGFYMTAMSFPFVAITTRHIERFSCFPK